LTLEFLSGHAGSRVDRFWSLKYLLINYGVITNGVMIEASTTNVTKDPMPVVMPPVKDANTEKL
jgi:hypothetical protein